MKVTLSRYNNNSISTKVSKTKLTTAGAISGAGSVRMEIYYGENWVKKNNQSPSSILKVRFISLMSPSNSFHSLPVHMFQTQI
jgi:hypothetical protein